METAIALVVLVTGCGGAGVALAWLNDRRQIARERRLPKPDARSILETRFAKGEIDETELHRRMHALVYGPPLELDTSSD